MLNIGKEYRIVKIDSLNLTFEKYTTIKKKDGSEIQQWKQVGNYYGNIGHCIRALKDYIIQDNFESLNSVDDLLELLDTIDTRYEKKVIER